MKMIEGYRQIRTDVDDVSGFLWDGGHKFRLFMSDGTSFRMDYRVGNALWVRQGGRRFFDTKGRSTVGEGDFAEYTVFPLVPEEDQFPQGDAVVFFQNDEDEIVGIRVPNLGPYGGVDQSDESRTYINDRSGKVFFDGLRDELSRRGAK